LPSTQAAEAGFNKRAQFLQQRRAVLKAAEAFRRRGDSPNLNLKEADTFLEGSRENAFAASVLAWNGDIFWAPASVASADDVINRFGDEIRSVFGPIPPFDVTSIGRRVRADGSIIVTAGLPMEVDGNLVVLKPNPNAPGNPLQFEHRSIDDVVVKWTSTVERCDKPSLAGGVTPCGAASRVSRVVKGNVEWLALARKTRGPEILSAESYWSPDDPAFALVGYIGFNRVTGELAFLDGSYPGNDRKFDWRSAIVPPGGAGYSDAAGRSVAATMYDPIFRVDCAACHDNKDPRIITPYIKHSRVGYRDPALAEVSSVGDLFPELMRNIRQPYRVVGSEYTATNPVNIAAGRAFEDPTGTCARCHGFTNLGTARFSSDSVGRLGSLTGDTAPENEFRTAWALRSGAGKIHPWMLPSDGNDISLDPPAPEMSDESWNKLRAALENPSSLPVALKLYTEAPAPESVLTEAARIADASGPIDISVTSSVNRDGVTGLFDREIQLTWRYQNTLGGVPTRDDVRFNVAVVEMVPPADNDPTPIEQYPTIEQAKGENAIRVSGGVLRDGKVVIFEDVSFVGHTRGTDPQATTIPRQYRVDFPGAQGKRYLIRLVAKRHTFDQSRFKYSEVPHVLSIDVN
jgi:mono/diheme cytochrome c family protein